MHQPRSTMNTALWTVQVLWGVFFSATGFGKVLCYNPALWNQALYEVPCFSAVRIERSMSRQTRATTVPTQRTSEDSTW